MTSHPPTTSTAMFDRGWEDRGVEAGKLLRLYKHPITRCKDEEQRQGWLIEDERIKALPPRG